MFRDVVQPALDERYDMVGNEFTTEQREFCLRLPATHTSESELASQCCPFLRSPCNLAAAFQGAAFVFSRLRLVGICSTPLTHS